MATSGSYDFSLNRDSILKGAIRIVKGMGGKVGSGTSKSPQGEIVEASEALNMMLKQWQAMGIGLWLNKELYVFFAYRDGQYSLGPSADHATLSMIETELSSSASSGASSISVDSITGISDGDYIGVELDDLSLQWTTINGSPSGSTITLTDVLTDSAGTDNNVYTYTTRAQRPLNITEARLHRDDGTETPLNVYYRDEWMEIANKSSNGTPNAFYYDPQTTNGLLNIWQRPNKVCDYLKCTAQMPIEDMDAAANDPDFPQEFYDPVKFNLAIKLSHEYEGIDPKRYLITKQQADNLLNTLINFDAEYASYYFGVSHDKGFRK
jgi:hypothetical protein